MSSFALKKADVRSDSFPVSEFGDIKSEVISIISDVLEPDKIHHFYRFHTKIKLDKQLLRARNREIPLQTGMFVTVNVSERIAQ
ncbi:MAG: hypothetical protein ACQJCO_06455 [cyanobacterium endosymbiont of Rhopalodia sterrenbergii]